MVCRLACQEDIEREPRAQSHPSYVVWIGDGANPVGSAHIKGTAVFTGIHCLV